MASVLPFRRRRPPPAQLRVLTASSQRIQMDDRQQQREQRKLRQGWQSQAWDLRDMVPELRYAVNFKANCSARMRIYVGAYAMDAGETDAPKRLEEIPGCPPEVIAACGAALENLGNGRMAISGLMHSHSSNWDVTGEGWLLGQEDPMTGIDKWSVRSVDEIRITENEWRLAEYPGDSSSGEFGSEVLDPELTYLYRMWNPHPRWQKLADSPCKAILDTLESLTIMRRDIRATARSRLAGAGILKVPDGLSIKVPTDDNEDPQADPFFDALTEMMMLPISDEGAASAVVPIVVRGSGELLSQLEHMDFTRPMEQLAGATRSELIGTIATGLDLPREVIEGVVDLNHWSAWQVDDNTFRHHLEPHEIQLVDALTGAHLRPFLMNDGQPLIPTEWVNRVVYWYDPVELVTSPDRTKDAQQAYTDEVISAAAYRRDAGYTEEDAPTIQELEARRIWDIRALPLNLLMELARRADPSLIVPAITGPGIVPGIKPGAVDMPPAVAAAEGVRAATAPPTSGPPTAATPDPAGQTGPPPQDGPPDAQAPADGVTASAATVLDMPAFALRELHRRAGDGDPDALIATGATVAPAGGVSVRLSRRLAMIDQDLRARMQTAANDAMIRRLEAAGARLRTHKAVLKDETMKTAIAHTRNERVSAVLGPAALVATGLTEDDLMGDWQQFKGQFLEWVAGAQKQTLTAAQNIAGLADDDPRLAAARVEFDTNREKAWTALESAMQQLGQHLLWHPEPTLAADWAEHNPATLVPSGMIRSALAVAGGDVHATTTIDHGSGVVSVRLAQAGQVGTGPTVSGLLTSAGGTRQGYQWVHGPSLHAFEPHENLDGVQFATFDDPQLANPGDWPPNEFFLPGDHLGCTCDFMPLWAMS